MGYIGGTFKGKGDTLAVFRAKLISESEITVLKRHPQR